MYSSDKIGSSVVIILMQNLIIEFIMSFVFSKTVSLVNRVSLNSLEIAQAKFI